MARAIYASNEPDALRIVADDSAYTTRLIRAMNWYSAEKLKSDARKYLREYVKKNMPTELSAFDAAKDSDIRATYGWLARLISHGAVLSDKHKSDFTTFLTQVLSAPQPVVVVQQVVTTPPKPSIQDAMKEKISEYLGNLEGCLDDIITQKQDFSLYKDMQGHQIPKPYVGDIQVWVNRKLSQFTEAYDGKDSQVVEGYSNIERKELRRIVKMFTAFVEDCDKYSEFKKANRKPRVVKAKPAGVQVKSLKYKKTDDELKLNSVSPTEIVGAQQVWFYNTKSRKLIVYRTDSSTGIQVKGSSLQNYQPDICSQKTLRKPEEQIKAMMGCSKVQLRKFLDTINAKAQAVNGRVNAEMVILKVVK